MEHMETHNLSVEVLGRWQQKFQKMCQVCEKEVDDTEARSVKHTCEGAVSISFQGKEHTVKMKQEYVQDYEQIDSSDSKFSNVFATKKETEKGPSVLKGSSPTSKRTHTSMNNTDNIKRFRIQPKKEEVNLEGKSRDSLGFHQAVAATVMSSLDHYYIGSAQFLGVARIRDEGMYTELARNLSHRLRKQIKESHLHLQGDLVGLQLGADHREFIKVEVESCCEKLPVI